MIIIKRIIVKEKYEIEEALAKLSFYLKLSLLDEDYAFCKEEYNQLIQFVENWINIYAKDKSLENIDINSVKLAQDIFYKIKFQDYKGFYYFEYIDAYLDKINYYCKK